MLLNLLAQAAARPALLGNADPGMFIFMVLLMVGVTALAWKLREPRQASAVVVRPSDPPASPTTTQSVKPPCHDSLAAPPAEREPSVVQREAEELRLPLVDLPAPPPQARSRRPVVRRPRNDSPTVC